MKSLIVFACLVLCGCAGSQNFQTHVVFVDATAPVPPGQLWPLRAGQLVLSESPPPHSLLFGLGTEEFFPFTHAAVIAIDEATGEPQVIDTAAEYKPGFARTPADALSGGPRRQPFVQYVAANLYVEVVEPASHVDRIKMAKRLDQLWQQKVPFDPYWDLSEHERLFCTEFVADILVSGGATPPSPVPLTRNPSLLAALRWFGVRGETSLPAAVLVGSSGRKVAAFSTWRHAGASRAYLEAKRELHRRFTHDQQIGNLLSLHGADVRVRPEVQAFLNLAAKRYDNAQSDALSEQEMRQGVQALATQTLGAFR